MLTVYKYPIEIGDYFTLELPAGAKILKVDAVNEVPYLWALLVDQTAPLETRTFRFAGTGHLITEPAERLIHVSSFSMNRGLLIWHIFEVKGSIKK